jgi:hypothetical protein
MSDSTHSTWEYRIESDLAEAALNRLGAEGWELVAVDTRNGNATCYLKRPRLDFREQVTLEQKARYYVRLPDSGDDGSGESDQRDRAAGAR